MTSLRAARAPRFQATWWAALASIAGCPSNPAPGDGGTTHDTEVATSGTGATSTGVDATGTDATGVDATGVDPTGTDATGVDESTGGPPQCGSGELGFLPAETVDVQSASWLGLFDLDGDGALDIVSGRSTGFTVQRNMGDGTFVESDADGTKSPPRGFAFGDFDANGTVDLGVTLATAETVLAYPGNGDGTFGQESVVWNIGGAELRDLEAGDFDGDGDLDLVIGRSTVEAGLARGQGNGGFDPELLSLGGYSTTIAAADLDDDGWLDLVVSSFGATEIRVLRGTPEGLAAAEPYPVSGGRSIVVHDLDGDGALDIVASGDDPTVTALRGTGTGTFEDGVGFPLDFTVQHMDAGDFDCDGQSELALVPAFSEDELVIMRGDGAMGSVLTIGEPVFVATGDLDGDGVADMVVAGDDTVVHLADP